MNRWIGIWFVVLLALGWVGAGCNSEDLPSRGEVSFEELNLALARIEASGQEQPDTPEQLLLLPELKGKELPTLPSGFHLAIDHEKNCVTVLID